MNAEGVEFHELEINRTTVLETMLEGQRANNRRLGRVLASLIAVALVMAGTLGYVTVVAVQSNRTADRLTALVATVEASRAEQRAAACVQSNDERLRIRTAIKSSLLALARGPLTPEQQTIVDKYNSTVDAGLPFRDCSSAGLDAYFRNPPADPAITTTTTRGAG